MPTYEYACQSCGKHVEVFQKFSDPPLTECAVCGGPLRKVFHPAGILFKGSGFYSTDSRRAGSKRSGDGGGDGSKPETAGSKSETTGSKSDTTGSKSDTAGSSSERSAASTAPGSSAPTSSKEKSA
jgi:putative FmdB family regulatory protein